jgi:hypothetical protein
VPKQAEVADNLRQMIADKSSAVYQTKTLSHTVSGSFNAASAPAPPTDTSNLQLVLILLVASFMFVIVVVFAVSRKFPESKPTALVVFIFSIVSFISTVLFLKQLYDLNDLAKGTDEIVRRFELTAVAAAAASIVINFVVVCRIVWVEMRSVPEFSDWVANKSGGFQVLATITLLAGLKIGCFGLLHSRLFYLRLLSAPVSEAAVQRLQIGSLGSTLVLDLPHTILQILLSAYLGTWSTQTALAFGLSITSLVIGIAQRVLLWCHVAATGQRAANKGGAVGKYAPDDSLETGAGAGTTATASAAAGAPVSAAESAPLQGSARAGGGGGGGVPSAVRRPLLRRPQRCRRPTRTALWPPTQWLCRCVVRRHSGR